LFGAVALVGVLGAGVMTFMKGPLATSIKLTRQNTAESQMAIAGQVAVMASATNGDCETAPDGYVEPVAWRDPAALAHPVNGGLIPMTIGVSKKDPWGTEYGYCAWDHGPNHNADDAGCGGAGQFRLPGTNSTAYPVVALVSAGADKAFTTTCRDFATADANSDGDLLDAGDEQLVSKANTSDDDIIFTYTYEEATGASGGLWSLKSGEPDTAVIGKNIETTGVAEFQGGVLLPDSSLITCDATTAGIMARAGSSGIEICDGSSWQTISGSSSGGVGLTLSNGTATPNVSSGMNVYGTCGNATCYSPSVTFTVTNSTAAVSDVLAVALSNTTNFEIVSDTCDGNTIAAGADCQIVVRAMATGNGAYAGTLEITGNNSPLATLDGTASNFTGCNAGGLGPGGYYVGCNVAGSYNLIVTPSGCVGGMTNPTCAGGPDTFTAQPLPSNPYDSTSFCCAGTGQQNTVDMMAYSGGVYNFPAANYCSGLVYGGYDDWFLPSGPELITYFYPNRAAVGYTTGGRYIGSTKDGTTSTDYSYLRTDVGTISRTSTAEYVRCMRRDPAATATPTPDTTPVISPTTGFATSYGTVAAATRTSNAITVYGVTGPTAISISGASGAEFSVNGGAYGSAASTVGNGQTVTLQVPAPAAGTEGLVTLTIGTATYTWTVRTIYAGNTVRIFTTNSSGFNGTLGISGADSRCTTDANAAGLAGNWVAVAQGATTASVADRLPWNWTMLKNMSGALVATSLADFVDGSVSAPMNISETGVVVSGKVMTGLSSSGSGYTASASGNCIGWTTTSSSYTATVGDPAVTGSGQYFSSGTGGCNNGLGRLLCMETTGGSGTDDDPLPVSFTNQVVYASGGTGYSNTVTLSGVSGPVNISIVPSAGTVDILKNGVSVGGGTTTAYQNDTLSFTMTAPAVAGTKNTATITLGTDTYTWWVGYADAASEAIVFVTSATVQGRYLGGLAGADGTCQSAATVAGYGGTWKALMSSSTVSAYDRMPFNWGVLKRTDGVVIANNWTDLWDGNIQNPIDKDENGNAVGASYVLTNTLSSGAVKHTSATYTCNDWTADSQAYTGSSGVSSSSWVDAGNQVVCSSNHRLYCFGTGFGTDLKPTMPNTTGDFTYAIQVPTSTLTTSNAVTVAGLGSGVSATVTITGASGSPGFTVNGAPGTSGVTTVQNGDVLRLTMTSPATDNTSYSMTVKVGTGGTVTWRVWTGDSTGTVVKRVFVLSTAYTPNYGGVVGADAKCQTGATGAALGGTWKAIMSGITEAEAAINRVGYNWSILKLVDNTTIVTTTGNLWKANSVPFTNAILKTQSGGTVAGANVNTNTLSTGMPAYTTSGNGNCGNWTGSASWKRRGLNSMTTGAWISNDDGGDCFNSAANAIYCIEQ
jgi:hypothetical protein